MEKTVNKKFNEYALLNFKRDSEPDGTLRFQPVVFYELNEDMTEENGTTLEEMLRVSIERLQNLNGRFPCRENSLALTKMQEALMWLNARTVDRVARGDEGKHLFAREKN
jgi:hypothetical protein